MSRLPADRPLLHMTSELARVMNAAKARAEAGHTMMRLERGEPDFDTPPHIVEALAAAARAGETHYPDARGSIGLREALVAKLERENDIRCTTDDVVVTLGGTHALFIAFQALLAPGDELLALAPYWMALPKIVGFIDGATLNPLPAYLELLHGTWTPAEFAGRLRAAIGPRTRGIYLNSPHNPTGAVLSRAHLEALAEVAIERDLWVVSDEAYEHILFDGARHISLASLPGMAERTVSAFTFSKSYAMTGWRIGYAVSPPKLRGIMGPILSFYSTHGVFPSVQSAAALAVTSSQECVATMRAAYQDRRDLLLAGLAGQSAVVAPKPLGSFYVFADVSRARAGRDLWALIEEWIDLGVAVLPGTAFGKGFDDHVRLSLVSKPDHVAAAARILSAHYVQLART